MCIAFVGINSLFCGTSALLLKQSPFVSCLKLYDPKTVDSAEDLSIINTHCKVKMYLGSEQLETALEKADIIVIGDDTNYGTDLDSALSSVSVNYGKYAKAIACSSPNAIIVIASTPVNCLLPMMSQLLVKHGCYNHNKVVGSTAVDTIRASAMLATHLNLDPKEVVLPVIGGSSEHTRVPVFSQSRPLFSMKKDVKTNLIADIRRGDDLVFANKGSPEVLNRAYSTVRFVNSIMSGLRGDPNISDITLCRTDLVPGVKYFSLPVMFGRDGIIKRYGIPSTTKAEDQMIQEAIEYVKKDADKAAFVVKESIELPTQRYLSSNDKATSQKELFDLYIKSLSKHVDSKPDAMPDYTSKTSSDNSFNSPIEKNSKLKLLDIHEHKSFQASVHNKLKNVATEDSFLKSTGFFHSPLQKPMLILEPMGCPSAPCISNEDDQSGDFLESNYNILHENELARTFSRKEEIVKDTNRTTNHPICATKTSFADKNVFQKKTVDPIAKFKTRIIKSPTSINPVKCDNTIKRVDSKAKRTEFQEIEESSNGKMSIELLHNSGKNIHNTRSTKTKNCTINDKTDANIHRINKKAQMNSSSSNPALWFDVSATEKFDLFDDKNMIDNLNYDIKQPFVSSGDCLGNQVKTDNHNNGEKELSKDCEEKRSEYQQNRVSTKHFTRSFFKNFGKSNSDGVELTSKSSSEHFSLPKYRGRFVESAVRLRNSINEHNRMCRNFKSKTPPAPSPFKCKQFDSRKKQPISPDTCFLVNRKNQTSDESSLTYDVKPEIPIAKSNNYSELNFKSETICFKCPNCRNEIVCHASQKIPLLTIPKSIEPLTQISVDLNKATNGDTCDQLASETITKTKQSICTNDLGTAASTTNVIAKNKSPELTNTSLNAAINVDQQEERLKKLKEKINKKLIPLIYKQTEVSIEATPSRVIRDSNLNSDRIIVLKPQTAKSSAAGEISNNETEKNGETRKKLDAGKVHDSSQIKWQGVPFVVKQSDLLTLDNNMKNASSTGVFPSDKNISTDTIDSNKNEECYLLPDITRNDIVKKSSNKLQLLIIPVEEDMRCSKLEAKTEINCNHEVQIVKPSPNKGICTVSDLLLDDVRTYMQSRIVNAGDINRIVDTSTAGSEAEKLNVSKKGMDDFVLQSSERNKTLNLPTNTTNDNENSRELGLKGEVKGMVSINTNVRPSVENSKEYDTNYDVVHVFSKCEDLTINCDKRAVTISTVKANPNIQLSDSGMLSQHINMNPVGEDNMVNSNTGIFTNDISLNQPKLLNKLQLLIKATQVSDSKQLIEVHDNDENHERIREKDHPCKKGHICKTPSQQKPIKKYEKISAAEKLVQSNLIPIQPAIRKNRNYIASNIMEDFCFPTPKRNQKTTNNLLKKLTISTVPREPAKKSNLKIRKEIRKYLRNVDSYGGKSRTSQQLKHQMLRIDNINELINSEYYHNKNQMAQITSEIISSRKQDAKKFCQHIEHSKKTINLKQRYGLNEMPPKHKTSSLLSKIAEKCKRDRQVDKSKGTLQTTLAPMPQVRYQPAVFEPTCEHMEFQPGTESFDSGNRKLFCPSNLNNTWESTIFNEYLRSSILPSLKDTRETFYLEETSK